MAFEIERDAPGANYVMWSSIGGGDFPLCLFYPELVTTPGMVDGVPRLNIGKYGDETADPWIFEALRKNEIGWMPMPFQGSVLAIKPLGNDVVVYGENGIARMSNVHVGLGATLSCQRVADFGIATETSLGGDEDQHVFIGTDGNLWTLFANGQLTRLGYEEFLSTYKTSTTLISLDAVNRHFYICHGGQTWLLTPQGMSQLTIYVGVSGIVHTAGSPAAVFTDYHTNYASNDVVFETDTLDMGHRGLKTLTRVELGYSSTDSSSVTKRVFIRYRTTEGGLWAWSSSATAFKDEYGSGFPVNNDGVAWCYITGVEFRIRVVIQASAHFLNPHESFALDWMNVWYMNVDKRFRRGV